MYAEERRLHILELLKERKRVEVAELAELLAISPETVRRDLNELEIRGLLQRTHGGAIYVDRQSVPPFLSLQARRDINAERKRQIAMAAVPHVADGDVIAIDNSTTVGTMLRFIPVSLTLTIVSYSLYAVMEIAARPDCDWNCILLGGTVNFKQMSLYGLLATNSLGNFKPAKLFMSCAGIDRDGQLTEGNLDDAEMKCELIKRSRRIFLLADESKFGRIGSVNQGTLDDVDCLITNRGLAPENAAILAERRIQVLYGG